MTAWHETAASIARTEQYIDAIQVEWEYLGGKENLGPPAALFAEALLFALAHPELARWWAEYQERLLSSLSQDRGSREFDAELRVPLDRLVNALRVEGEEA